MEPAELHNLVQNRHQKTPEIHPPNDFYGHAATLKRYAGLPPDRPLSAVVEHGPAPAPRIWDIDRRAPFPTYLCAGARGADAYEKARPDGRGIPVGPMIRYAAGEFSAARPQGRLLVFPAHSTHYVKSVYDAPAFARALAGYRERFAHITVCLYWKDALDGMDAPYRAEGFECTSAGHMFDLDFLDRLRRVIEQAEVVASNQFGSYIPYAIALDRPAWLLQQDVRLVGSKKDVARDTVAPDVFEDLTREVRELFSEEVDQVTEAQRESLDPFTGFGHVWTPEEIRGLLAEAEERYRARTNSAQRGAHWIVGRVARPLVARVRLR